MRAGTLVICVQNLDFSGANQVVLNIVSGHLHESNVIVLAPKVGSFAARFVETGAAVRFGNLSNLLDEIKDVFCIICNTIMTAQHVVDMAQRPHPVIWILHEWWDDEMIKENLRIRNLAGMNLDTVKQALKKASCVVFVCEAQRSLYKPQANSAVIYVGVPAPLYQPDPLKSLTLKHKLFTFLCLGIVCPRKNQVWAVELFREFAGDRQDVRLLIVGARYTRDYEIQYVEEVKRVINGDPRIELLNVTENVEQYYEVADALLLTSVNEVTPMVISEAMSWGIPILSTNIAGIPEMFDDGLEGFLFSPGDNKTAINGMRELVENPAKRRLMGLAGAARFASTFDLEIMVEKYRELMLQIAPPIILLDMDGALVDWDSGFRAKWADRSTIDRTKSYYMQLCVDEVFYREAELLMLEEGFFEGLPEMPGAIEAAKEMEKAGFNVFICTSPILKSRYCTQEKLNWIRNYLGESWLHKVIISPDKTVVRGDLLVDDKPFEFMAPGGTHTTATWKQVIFDAPYNSEITVPRLNSWTDWKEVVMPLFGKSPKKNPYALQYGAKVVHPPMDAISPRARRNKGRATDKQTAQWTQECLLGRLNDNEEPLSPDDIAAIKGSGSFYDDNGCIDARTGKCLIKTFQEKSRSPEGIINTEEGVTVLPPPDKVRNGYDEEKIGARNIDLEPIRPNSLLIPSQVLGDGHIEEKVGVKPSSLFCDFTKIPFSIPRVQRVHESRENRFGGDDDYANNFEVYSPQPQV